MNWLLRSVHFYVGFINMECLHHEPTSVSPRIFLGIFLILSLAIYMLKSVLSKGKVPPNVPWPAHQSTSYVSRLKGLREQMLDLPGVLLKGHSLVSTVFLQIGPALDQGEANLKVRIARKTIRYLDLPGRSHVDPATQQGPMDCKTSKHQGKLHGSCERSNLSRLHGFRP